MASGEVIRTLRGIGDGMHIAWGVVGCRRGKLIDSVNSPSRTKSIMDMLEGK
jgi:hypothetical protein